MSALVLVIARDQQLRESITRHLKKERVAVQGAATVGQGVTAAKREAPALVVLDRGLVDGRAAEICQELRQLGGPLILLLAEGGSSAEAVAALEAGADDYMSLPCSLPELIARIVSLLRRRRDLAAPSAPEIRVGDLTLFLRERQVTLHGRPVSLAPKEFEILAVLAERAERVVTREELVRLVWSVGQPIKRQTLDVYLFSLRSKIEDEPERPARLLTVRGVGYRLIAPASSRCAASASCTA